MSLTDITLVILIIVALAWAIYVEWVLNRLHGGTRLRIILRRQNRLDGLIFVGLVIILIYKNITNNGPIITTTLLSTLAFMAIYLFWFRQPSLLFKNTGFYYANAFILYSRIKSMNLSEDGVLVIELEQRRLLIHVKQLDDLEKIYHFMIESR
ncbi:DUF986 domain-containing protein [Affinibrenneria salicis]|uniref:UPF0266 membrane protein FJU30_05545 n=1 Tax=Affinibrenneria salicis TaxID=2590031 RepID=A0A5J5G5N6_9GAMM|nr:DUF986 family protein [Affinibrenneria salicis]KAA9001756.1 DUF986 domain-containing protein [Affinibrenneria salicis]